MDDLSDLALMIIRHHNRMRCTASTSYTGGSHRLNMPFKCTIYMLQLFSVRNSHHHWSVFVYSIPLLQEI